MKLLHYKIFVFLSVLLSQSLRECGETVIKMNVLEGGKITLPCKVNMNVIACMWEKGTTLITIGNKAKYDSVEDPVGSRDCSITIKNAELSDDEIWKCAPVFEKPGGFRQLPQYDVDVNMMPEDPVMYAGTKLLVADETDFNVIEHAKDKLKLSLRCESLRGNPAAVLRWRVNKLPVENVPTIVEAAHHVMNAKSTLYFELPPKNKLTEVMCIATHVAYKEGEDRRIKVFFQAIYPSAMARFVPRDTKFILENEHSQITYECQADGNPLPDIHWEVREYDKTWSTISKEARITLNRPGHYRCSAGNKLNAKRVHSMRIKVMRKPNSTTTTEEPPILFHFLQEPFSIEIFEGHWFILPCVANIPLASCLWIRGSVTFDPSRLPKTFRQLGSIKVGDCTIKVLKANRETDETNWSCHPVLSNTSIMQSRTIYVHVIDYQSNPLLEFDSKTVYAGDHVYIDFKDGSNSINLTVRCVYTASHRRLNVLWKIADEVKVADTRIEKNIAKPHSYLMTSKITFPMDKISKDNTYKNNEILLTCEVTEEAFGNKPVTTEAVFISRYPTSNVAAIPEGPEYILGDYDLKFYCYADGFPPASFLWQMEDQDEWRNIDLKGFKLSPTSAGKYRCTAGNILNHEFVASPTFKIIASDETSKPGIIILYLFYYIFLETNIENFVSL